MSDSGATDRLRDELAQAIHERSGGGGDGGENCRSCLSLADAVLVLVEQRIAAERAEWGERYYQHGEDGLRVGYQKGWDAGVAEERERIAAKIEALGARRRAEGIAVLHEDDVLRMVRGDE